MLYQKRVGLFIFYRKRLKMEMTSVQRRGWGLWRGLDHSWLTAVPAGRILTGITVQTYLLVCIIINVYY